MDALPIFEENKNKKYKSKCDGKMHACPQKPELGRIWKLPLCY